MTSQKPTLRDNVKLLELILERVESIDRSVDEILEWVSGNLGDEYSWYDDGENESVESHYGYE
jgi:hypothetical protein